MHVGDSLYCVESIKFECATGEPLCEVTVAGMILVWHLVAHGDYAEIIRCCTIVHVMLVR